MPNVAANVLPRKETAFKRNLDAEKRKARLAPKTGTAIELGALQGPGMASEIARGEKTGEAEAGGERGIARTLRTKMAQARQLAAAVRAAPEAAREAAKQAVKNFTAQALKFSWLNLIDSFGLTYFYILFHFVVAYILGVESFCRFGEEWSPPGAGEAAKKFARSFGFEIFEIIAMILVGILIATIIFLILTAIVAVISAVASPITTTLKLITASISGQ